MTNTPAQDIALFQADVALLDAVLKGAGGGATVDLRDGNTPVKTLRSALEEASGQGNFVTTDTPQTLTSTAKKTFEAGAIEVADNAAGKQPVNADQVSSLTTAAASGLTPFATYAEMIADASHTGFARVGADPDATKNGTYYRATTADAWASSPEGAAAQISADLTAKIPEEIRQSAGVSLFADPLFVFCQSKTAKFYNKFLVYQSTANGVWDASYRSPYQNGAWRYDNATGGSFGFLTDFGTPGFLSSYNIVAGDIISSGMLLDIPANKTVRAALQFYNTGENDLLGTPSVVDVVGTGNPQAVVIENQAVQPNGHGCLAYTFPIDATDYHVLAHWVVLSTAAGKAPPPKRLPDIYTGRAAGLASTSQTLSVLLGRAVGAAGTVGYASDVDLYFVKRAPDGGALWTPFSAADLAI